MNHITATLDLGESTSALTWCPGGPGFEVALGFGRIGGRAWQGPLSALRVEDAIQHVEDTIEPWSRLSARQGLLAVDAQALARLAEAGAGPDAQGMWAADAVEQAYQRLAMRATRGEAAMADPAQDATVLIVRECLHHGGFEGLIALA